MPDTPLHEACEKASLGKAQQLLDSGEGTKYLEVKGYHGRTPLHYAARYDKFGKIVEVFIQHGANIEARDNYDNTPLIIASFSNNPSAALVLLRHGPNIEAQNRIGFTTLHYAFRFGYKEVAEIILNFVVDSAIASSSSLSLGLGKGLEEARNLVTNIRDYKSDMTAWDDANLNSKTEIIQWWETFQREKEDLQQQEQRLYMLERTDRAMDALWPHALHKAGKKSISHLWYFVQMKGPSLIAESKNSRSAERGQAPKSFQREQ